MLSSLETVATSVDKHDGVLGKSDGTGVVFVGWLRCENGLVPVGTASGASTGTSLAHVNKLPWYSMQRMPCRHFLGRLETIPSFLSWDTAYVITPMRITMHVNALSRRVIFNWGCTRNRSSAGLWTALGRKPWIWNWTQKWKERDGGKGGKMKKGKGRMGRKGQSFISVLLLPASNVECM